MSGRDTSIISPYTGNRTSMIRHVPNQSKNHGHVTRFALMTFIMLMIFASGCTQPVPASVPVPVQPEETGDLAIVTSISPVPGETRNTGKMVAATATKPDSTKIIITYTGGRDADRLMELETTITDSKGTTRTQSMGSRLGTTPVQSGGTDTFYGPYTEKAHLITIGYFSDGTHQDILDTWI